MLLVAWALHQISKLVPERIHDDRHLVEIRHALVTGDREQRAELGRKLELELQEKVRARMIWRNPSPREPTAGRRDVLIASPTRPDRRK